MGLFDDTCTLYNLHTSRQGTSYHRTVLTGISWHKTCAVTVRNNKDLLSADRVQINIPIMADTQGKSYLSEPEWNQLDDPDRSRFWTMKNGDFVVCGNCSEAQPPDGAFCLFSWNDSLKGSPRVRHYRMEAK